MLSSVHCGAAGWLLARVGGGSGGWRGGGGGGCVPTGAGGGGGGKWVGGCRVLVG